MLSEHSSFLERAFRILNTVYFENKLPEAVITIQSAKRCFGYITVKKVWKDELDSYREINISAEYLNRTPENIIATLLHEMCHLYAMENGIRDTSNHGRYHNKEFKKIAESRGLKIGYQKYIGWSVTSSADGLAEVIKQYHLDSPIEYVRMGEPDWNGGIGGASGSGGSSKKKSSTRKYMCPGCNNSIRATKDVNIMCMDCRLQMIKQEP